MSDLTARLSTAIADRYRIERHLGAGGMATVYLAHDAKHNRKVALKVLRPELAAVIGAERFLKEIEVTANLQHPHILPLHDSGEADTFLYYVMPYVEGETLRDKLVREKQLGIDQAIEITRSVAAALDYAHRHGVIHRDIKPENILLHDGQPLIADFGIALAVSAAGGTRLTETGLSLGTPHYMSPEQAMGDRELDARSDVYSLGAMLYEMLAGDPPYTGSTAQAIVAKVITEKAPPVTMHRDTVPPHVAAAVAKALNKLPADRFPSAAEFAAALTNPAFSVPTTVVGPAADTQARRWRSPASLGATGLVALLAGIALWGWLRPRPPRPVSRQRIVLWDHAALGSPVAVGLAISPDGSTIVFIDSVGGTTQLWAKDRDQTEAKPLSGTAGARGPFFSPDGEWIAFVADGRLKKVPRAGGSAITLADSANGGVPAGAWLDDGTIVFNHGQFHLLRVSDAGGRSQRVVTAADIGNRGVITATALPDGRGVLFGACTPGCSQVELRVLDLRTGKSRVLVDEVAKGWYVPTGEVVYVRRDGGVFAAPFDLGDLETRAAAVPVLEGVRTVFTAPELSLSPSGMVVYMAGASDEAGGVVEAVWVSRDGKAAPIDSGWRFNPSGNAGLALSPDGKRLAVSIQGTESQDIWIKQLDRGPLTRLTFEGDNFRPSWTADGRSVLYASNRPEKPGDLYGKRADGSGPEEALLDLSRGIYEAFWAPGGRWLVLRLGQPPSRDIVAVRPGVDSVPVPLVAAERFEEASPTLSPDGKWLAYTSNESGRNEVYVRPFPNAGDGKWQVSTNGGAEPLWSRGGRELFYRDGTGNLVTAAVAPGPAFTLGAQRVLFSAQGYNTAGNSRGYDVSPDDRRFVMTRVVGTGQAEDQGRLILVENWFAELWGRTKK